MKEKKLRIEDALAATKVAVEEGIVAGGGIACMNAIPAVAEFVDTLEGDAKTGAKIVLKALEEPLRQIVANAGLEGGVICDNVKKANKVGYGFNALTEEYTDMVSAGIVDPTKVTRSALQNASSVANNGSYNRITCYRHQRACSSGDSRKHLIWAECTNPVRL